jgi:hypothetical protein
VARYSRYLTADEIDEPNNVAHGNGKYKV